MVWAKTVLLQARANNQGNQNEGQTPNKIIAGFDIFQLLIETKSHWLHASASKLPGDYSGYIKMQNGFFGQGLEKKV